MLGDADGIYPVRGDEFDTKEEAEAAGTAGQTVLAIVKIKTIPAEVEKDEAGGVIRIVSGGLVYASVSEMAATIDWQAGYSGGVVNFWPITAADDSQKS